MVEFPLTHPPTRLFAYVNSYPNDQVMGIVIDGRTGKVLETLILPTKQRVMLGLGIANDNAHAHHMYRRLYPHGYRLIWTDDPKEDIRLSRLKHELEESAGELRRDGANAPRPETIIGQRKADHEVDNPLPQTRQLTADIMRGGVEKAKSTARRTTDSDRSASARPRASVPQQPDASHTGTERRDTPPVKSNPEGSWF